MRSGKGVGLVCGAALLIAGCTVVQFGENAPDPSVAEQLKKEVPTYDDAQLAAMNDYIRVGSINAFQCRMSLIGGAADDVVIGMLRRKAHDMGANGLTDLSCTRGPTSETQACFSSTACSATALKIVPPDSSAH